MIYIIMVAISLSMDAFSLSLCIGTLNIRYNKILFFSIVVGILHFIMPMLGVLIGDNLLNILTINIEPKYITSIIFFVLALFIIIEKSEVEDRHVINILSLIMIAFTVSIDSFFAGIGLNLIDSRHLLYAITFSIFSFMFTLVGLIIGKYAKFKLGVI